jgi:hypothetical protein
MVRKEVMLSEDGEDHKIEGYNFLMSSWLKRKKPTRDTVSLKSVFIVQKSLVLSNVHCRKQSMKTMTSWLPGATDHKCHKWTTVKIFEVHYISKGKDLLSRLYVSSDTSSTLLIIKSKQIFSGLVSQGHCNKLAKTR